MDIQNKNNLSFNIFTILLAALFPIILIFFYGDKVNSLSNSWRTPFQPLYIFSNLLTSYILFKVPKWTFSSIFLFLLTIFSIDHFQILHNIFAVLFFLMNIYPMMTLKKYNLSVYLYLMAIIWFPNILYFETHAVLVLCGYHLLLLLKYHSITKNRHTEED
jgi:hypothetical protein